MLRVGNNRVGRFNSAGPFIGNGNNSGGGTTQPLRFASPNNNISNNAGQTMTTTFLEGWSRMMFYIGSGNLSELRFSYHSFNLGATAITQQANGYTILGLYLENSAGTQSVQITFGGSGTKVINAGDTDIQSDPILPSAFSLSSFSRDTKWYIRQRLSVASTGQILPTGVIPYTTAGFSANVSISVDPAGYSGNIAGTGTLPLTGTWADNYKQPFYPIILGRFVSGDPPTILLIGDSIISGAGDTSAVTRAVVGSAGQALSNTDFATGNIGGCNMGSSGAIASMWSGANAPKLTVYWQYAKHAVEEFGTNYNTSGTTTGLTTIQNDLTALWALMRTKGIGSIIRPLLTPRCTSTDSFVTTANQSPLTAAWVAPSGTSILLNDWLPTVIGPAGPTTIVTLNSVRASTVLDTTLYYTWQVDGTAFKYVSNDGQGVHPTTFGHVQEAVEYRTAYATLT